MDHFCGRKEILGSIRKRVGDLKEGYRQNLVFIGSHHVGKSSILLKFLHDFDDSSVIPVYLNLENRDLDYFVSKATRGFLYQYARLKGLPLQDTLPLLAETVRSGIPRTAEAALEAAALLEKGKLTEAYQAVLRLPDIFIKESGLFCVFILDEFHQLEDLGVDEPFRALADSITMQKGCLFIITSSYEEQAKRNLAERLTLLFGNFEMIMVQPFDLKASQHFIECRMGDVRMGLSLRNFLSDFTGGRPLYLDIILQELINLSAIYKQQEIYAPLVVQAVENLVFNRWGALSRYFELIVDRLCAGRSNRLVMDVLFSLVNGMHKAKDIVELLGVKPGQVTQRLSYLVDQDIVEKNGTYFYIKDKLLRYWVKYVFQRRVKSVDMEPSRSHKGFKDEVTRAINEFQVTSRKDLSTRMTELARCFENEMLSLRGQTYKLPLFTDIKALKIKSRGGNYFDVLQAQTEEGLWLLVLRKDPVAEGDINAVAEEARRMGIRPRRCVIVSMSELDDAAKLKALEERMWIWNEPELNSLMNLYDKPYLVP